MKLVPEQLPSLSPEQIAEMADILRLLGEPSRLRILLACLAEPAPVGEIAERVRIPRALVSHHLRLLRASRLLRAERCGKQVIYMPLDERVRCIVVDLAHHVLTEPEPRAERKTDVAEALAAPHDDATARYRVTGMDCPSCAAKIEKTVRSVAGVEAVRVSIASQLMTLRLDGAGRRLPEVERTVTALGYRLDRLVAGAADIDDDLPKDLAHTTPTYRHALRAVVALNVGYGLVEMIGGFVSGSQALKADALDFLGDGLITFLGLLAIGWSLAWRARSALVQGLFLGALGFGILATTAYRVLVLNQPEAELMGLFGLVALAVNVAAAFVLLPHRTGDANVRAVWLFSRNDALGNLAVVVAAGLVAWTGTPWPDLAVAAVIAALFLQSSWSIMGDAWVDLREAVAAPATE